MSDIIESIEEVKTYDGLDVVKTVSIFRILSFDGQFRFICIRAVCVMEGIVL